MIHLHGWSHYSMLSAIGTPKDILSTVKSLGQTAIAITDYNAGYGLLEFYENAKDIKPILGVDINFSYDGKNIMNIVLLAKTYIGYQNLIKLISIANTKNFKIIPYINLENIKEYSKDLIALSGGNGEIEKLILGKENNNIILEKISQYEELFNGEFYLEFLTYDYESFPDRKVIEDSFKEFIKKGKKVVVSSAYKYPNKEDKLAYDVLLCIKNNWKYYDNTRPKVNGDHHIMSDKEVRTILTKNGIDNNLQNILITNTENIASSINCKIPLHQLLFPKYVVPKKYKDLYTKL